jgi:hypothetical protein
MDEVFPFLPADFDERYYQAAPLDQHVPKTAGDQPVTLINLTPDGRRDFVIPHFEAPVYVFPRRGKREDLTAALDTIVIEPDAATVALTWRVTRPLARDVFEIAEVLVGKKGLEWWRFRDHGGLPFSAEVDSAEPVAKP